MRGEFFARNASGVIGTHLIDRRTLLMIEHLTRPEGRATTNLLSVPKDGVPERCVLEARTQERQ